MGKGPSKIPYGPLVIFLLFVVVFSIFDQDGKDRTKKGIDRHPLYSIATIRLIDHGEDNNNALYEYCLDGNSLFGKADLTFVKRDVQAHQKYLLKYNADNPVDSYVLFDSLITYKEEWMKNYRINSCYYKP